MSRAMRTGALLVALIVLSTYWAGAAAKKKEKHHGPQPAPYEYSPAAEVLIQQAKAPGADGGSYINAAKHVAPAPQVDQMIQQEQSISTPGEAANLQAAKQASESNPNMAGR
ncbi:g7062 [Coccomyxa viridis]|uniref:G7062 protein n=1 Tax=Coccomyxa viridis TaxID=1274662 RepID=A0ABP1FZ96_9CHLO